MDSGAKSTKPKPFVFVLMPFDHSFNDIYKFGIKGAAEEAGAYAERVDEQIYAEGILERVFNQINKADVVIADMTDRNANVFYEVGYAHALGKTVLLLTQKASDIPFDLQHHPHTIYAGQIDTLRKELIPKIHWAIKESAKAKAPAPRPPYDVSVSGVYLPFGLSGEPAPTVLTIAKDWMQSLSVVVRNSSAEPLDPATYMYLFSGLDSVFEIYAPYRTGGFSILQPLKAHPSDASDGLLLQHRLPGLIPMLPQGASEEFYFGVSIPADVLEGGGEEPFRLRIHTTNIVCDYRFTLAFQKSA